MANDLNDTTASDILTEVRREIAANRAANSTNTNPVINYNLIPSDTVNISDAVNLNDNKHSFSETVNISDYAVLRQFRKDRFLIPASEDEKYLNSGRRVGFTGSNYLSITKHVKLQPTAALTLAVRVYLSGFTGTQRNIFHNQDANNGYIVYCQSGANNIVAEWYSGSGLISSQTASFTPNTWTNFVFTFQSGNQILYKNGVSVDSDTTTATMTASSADIGVGGTATGSNLMVNGDMMENFVIIDRYVNSGWASDYNNNLTLIDQSTDYIPVCAGFAVTVA